MDGARLVRQRFGPQQRLVALAVLLAKMIAELGREPADGRTNSGSPMSTYQAAGFVAASSGTDGTI
jgi:hypothetical protein